MENKTLKSETIVAAFPNISIEIHKIINKFQILKFFPECIPGVAALDPKSLNNKYSKLVHSSVVQKLKPYFVCGTSRYQFDAGYIDLPDELLQELIVHLSSANQKAMDK